MTQPTLPDRKPPVFLRCPVCGTEFQRIAEQQRCSRECAQVARRHVRNTALNRLIAEKVRP
jgi:hypothetical protein